MRIEADSPTFIASSNPGVLIAFIGRRQIVRSKVDGVLSRYTYPHSSAVNRNIGQEYTVPRNYGRGTHFST
jgi:hypothetical protein